ncbi:MAG TPA: signal peptidase I [Sphingomicrobium sp.]|nr:signal peptidase I [Sphingomicrobium sp.]
MRWFRQSPKADYADPPAEASPKPKESLLRFLVTLALLAWALRSFVAAPFNIPSGSMLPTLRIGDYMLVAKWPYGYSRYSFPWQVPSFDGRIFGRLPERGDVVVFRPPGADGEFVKRLIGLPGDTIEVRGGTLILNGKALSRESRGRFAMPIGANSPCRVVPPADPMVGRDMNGEPACLYPAYRETLPGGPSYLVLDQVENPVADDFGPIRVPQGHVFMMGDNRDDSLDSRFSPAIGGVGLVPVDHLVGRALIIFWSTDGSASYVKPWSWFSALRGNRIGTTFSQDAP